MNNVKRIIFSQEEKKAICQKVKDLIDKENMSTKDARKKVAKEYKIDPGTITNWDREFRKFSSAKQDWTDEKRKTICQKVKKLIDTKNMSTKEALDEVAKEYEIHPGTIVTWDQKFRKFSSESEVKLDWTDKEREAICQQVKDLIDTKNMWITDALKEVANKYGIDRSSINRWDQKFRKFSSEVKQDWTKKEKKAICQKVKDLIDKENMSTKEALEEVAKEYNLHPETIKVWDREYRIFSSEFDGKNWTEVEKKDICYKVKARMEATGCSAMLAIVDILAEINKRDAIKQYYNFEGEVNQVYNWNRDFKYIFETKGSERCLSKYPDNKKREILEEVNEGKKVKDVAKNYNLSDITLYMWNKRLKVIKTKKQILEEATKKQILEEATKKLEQKITMEEKVQKTNIDMVSNKQNDGR